MFERGTLVNNLFAAATGAQIASMNGFTVDTLLNIFHSHALSTVGWGVEGLAAGYLTAVGLSYGMEAWEQELAKRDAAKPGGAPPELGHP